jgi:hypothetical protein
MDTLKQNVSIRSQAIFVISLVVLGWLSGFAESQFATSFLAGVVDIISYATPIFTLILIVSYFLSGRAHARWLYLAVLSVIASISL